MKTLDFSKVKFKPAKYYKSNGAKQREVVGWDTETSKGQCGLLCNSDGQVVNSHKADTLLAHLTELPYSKTVNLFYNLVYDYSAIAKCLPLKCVTELAQTNHTKYNEFDLFIIPRKLFKVTIPFTSDTGREYDKTFKYFDLLQFFKYEKSASLDNVSEKYLNERKLDVEAQTGIKKENYKFRDFNNKLIQRYCVDDATKVRRLAEIIVDSCQTIGLRFNQPYSCATLSMNYVYELRQVKSPLWFYFNKPKHRKVFEYAFNAYSGGRFEVMRRGTFHDVYEYDVNSMYPDKIRKLQSVYKTDFEFCQNAQCVDRLRDDETAYAFLKVRVKPTSKFLNLLPVRRDGLMIYPRSRQYFTTHIALSELELLEDYDVDFTIVDGYVGTPEVVEYPYKEIFEEIYHARMRYPKSHFLSSLYKIIMNSFYGKTIEMNVILEELSEAEADGTPNGELSCAHDVLDMVIDDQNEDIIVKNYQAGKFFCSVYAADITAPSRCVVTRAMLEASEEDVVGCFTDSVLSLSKLDLPVSDQLGEWELTRYDECNMVGTGVYYLHDHDKSKEKTRTRGFRLMNLNDFDFQTFLRNEYKTRKTLTLKEAVRCHNFDDFNVISEDTKELNINFDTKRRWQRPFKNVRDIFKSQIGSETLVV